MLFLVMGNNLFFFKFIRFWVILNICFPHIMPNKSCFYIFSNAKPSFNDLMILKDSTPRIIFVLSLLVIKIVLIY